MVGMPPKTTDDLDALKGFASANRTEPQEARFFRITFPQPCKPILNIGPGDHTCQRWHLTMDDLRGLVLDSLPHVIK
jgi:hypothetical protein